MVCGARDASMWLIWRPCRLPYPYAAAGRNNPPSDATSMGQLEFICGGGSSGDAFKPVKNDAPREISPKVCWGLFPWSSKPCRLTVADEFRGLESINGFVIERLLISVLLISWSSSNFPRLKCWWWYVSPLVSGPRSSRLNPQRLSWRVYIMIEIIGREAKGVITYAPLGKVVRQRYHIRHTLLTNDLHFLWSKNLGMMCSTIFSLSWTTKACPDGDQLSAELNSDSDAHSIVWYSLKGNVCFDSTILVVMMAGLSSCCVVLLFEVWEKSRRMLHFIPELNINTFAGCSGYWLLKKTRNVAVRRDIR